MTEEIKTAPHDCERGEGCSARAPINKKDSDLLKNIRFSEEDLSIHLSILGNRETYCIVGGKHEWSETKDKYEIPNGKVFTKWLPKDRIIPFIREKNNISEQCGISLNDKEFGNDSNKGVTAIYVIWFDIDAPRADKNKPARSEESEVAYTNALKLRDKLREELGVVGIIGKSGNGYQIFYPLERLSNN